MKSSYAYLIWGCVVFLSACSREEVKEAHYYEDQWTKIDKMLLEEAFAPNETRTISFATTASRHVQLITDKGYELSMKERNDGKSGILLSSVDHPDEYVVTSYGASTLFKPENGVIRLKVTNQSDLPLRIAVCTVQE